MTQIKSSENASLRDFRYDRMRYAWERGLPARRANGRRFAQADYWCRAVLNTPPQEVRDALKVISRWANVFGRD